MIKALTKARRSPCTRIPSLRNDIYIRPVSTLLRFSSPEMRGAAAVGGPKRCRSLSSEAGVQSATVGQGTRGSKLPPAPCECSYRPEVWNRSNGEIPTDPKFEIGQTEKSLQTRSLKSVKRGSPDRPEVSNRSNGEVPTDPKFQIGQREKSWHPNFEIGQTVKSWLDGFNRTEDVFWLVTWLQSLSDIVIIFLLLYLSLASHSFIGRGREMTVSVD